MIRSAVAVRGNKGVTGTLAANAGDVRLRAVIGNPNFGGGPTVDIGSLSFSLEKPGSFILDFDVPNQDVRFQFMNTMSVFEKQLNWTYTHSRSENRTVLDATLILDPSNKISASSEIGSRNRRLKYTYVHRGGTTLEPCYDFAKNAWDVAASHSFDGDVVRASYNTRSKNLGVEWSWKAFLNKEGAFKILASFNLAEGLHRPTLSAESSWNLEL